MERIDFLLSDPYLLGYLYGLPNPRDRHNHFLALVQNGMRHAKQHKIDPLCPPTDADLGWSNPPMHPRLRIRFSGDFRKRLPANSPFTRSQLIVSYARLGLYAHQQQWRAITQGETVETPPSTPPHDKTQRKQASPTNKSQRAVVKPIDKESLLTL